MVIMREVNLRSVDLNLLVVLQHLLDARHVSRAADRLGMSQPAVSRALQRLRDMLHDPLLVRTREGYDLSERAQQIQPELEKLLAGIGQLVQAPHFDPASAKGPIRFSGLDLEIALYLPRLSKLLLAEAPGLQIEIIPQVSDHFQHLDQGDVHFCFTELQPQFAADQFHRRLVSEMRGVCIMDRNHPLADGMTLDQYAAAKQGMVSITGKGPGTMDRALAGLGRSRHLTLRLSSFMSVADFCEGSDIIFALPRDLAEHIARGRDLVIRPMPPELPDEDIRFHVYWHERHHHDPMCVWVREKMREAFDV